MLTAMAWVGRAEAVTWPVLPCTAQEVASASPAPMVSDDHSLIELPFVVNWQPVSAAIVIGLDDTGGALIRCVYVNDQSVGLEGAAIVAVAGLKFAPPRLLNTSVPNGRYLVRVSTLLGFAHVDAPPQPSLLPVCGPSQASRQPVLPAPKPVSRVNPSYPAEALIEELEGWVTIRLEVYSDGSVSPLCLRGGAPPGWFEHSAVEALSQWHYDRPPWPGLRYYDVTVRFRLED